MRALRMRACAFFLVLGGGPALAAPAAHENLSTIALPGGSAGIGFDDLGFSRALGRVLVPAGGTGSLDLVDPASGAVTVIGGLGAPGTFGGGHGEGLTSVDEGFESLFAIDRTGQRLVVVDPRSKRAVASVALASGPDYVRHVASTGEVWITEPDADRIEIFRLGRAERARPEHEAFLKIAGGPESLVIDAGRGRAYTNLWTDTTLAIDLKSRSVVGRWKNGCGGSRGLALDPDRALLFVGCQEGKGVTLDASHEGKMLASLEVGAGVDIIAFSPKLAHLYLPGARAATLTILGVSSEGHLALLGTERTAPGAHCVVADDSGNAYVCDPHGGRLLVIQDRYPAAR